jgi:CRISPR-associated protein Cas8a1/Csx13
LAAENLIQGQPWWKDFANFVADQETRDHVFRWERKGLGEMVRDDAVMPEGEARRFVRACHEAWRRRLGQLGERARAQRLDFGQLAGQEFERTRIAFSRCKTQADFRRTVTDFWARGGSQPELREHWQAVLPFLTDAKRWMEGRDLALLALASYAVEGDDSAQPGAG